MQPLISPVDHESRRNSIPYDEEGIRPSEMTPLLNRFSDNDHPQTVIVTIVTVGVLLTLLLAGVVIGIYLLILENRSENVLPPVDKDKKVLSVTHLAGVANKTVHASAKYVIVTQTDTETCDEVKACQQLIKSMQVGIINASLPYNYMISSDGLRFVVFGKERLDLFPPLSSLIVAFIGNFADEDPTKLQIDAFKELLTNSVKEQYLDPSFTIIGKNSKFKPNHLFKELAKLPQWNKHLPYTYY